MTLKDCHRRGDLRAAPDVAAIEVEGVVGRSAAAVIPHLVTSASLTLSVRDKDMTMTSIPTPASRQSLVDPPPVRPAAAAGRALRAVRHRAGGRASPSARAGQPADCVCSCDACAILFSGQQDARYPPGPSTQSSCLPDFRLTDAQWEDLHLPINLAFFVRRARGRAGAGLLSRARPGPRNRY